MPKKTEYKEIYEKFMDYQQSVHHKNQKKIQVGLKVNIILPLFFLILSFAISNGKLVFLILWIISLFGIAGYLIYIEFSDYKMMQKMQEFGVSDINSPNGNDSFSPHSPKVVDAEYFVIREGD